VTHKGKIKFYIIKYMPKLIEESEDKEQLGDLMKGTVSVWISSNCGVRVWNGVKWDRRRFNDWLF
jgi:hypothetical protein